MLFPLAKGFQGLRSLVSFKGKKITRGRLQAKSKVLESCLKQLKKSLGGKLSKELVENETGLELVYRLSGEWGSRFHNSEFISGGPGYFLATVRAETAIGSKEPVLTICFRGSLLEETIALDSPKYRLREMLTKFSERTLVEGDS